MKMNVSQTKGSVPISVIQLEGQLDGQTYQELIAKVQELFSAGSKDLLFDLSELKYISSAGLVALHTSAIILNGEALPDSENGWASVKSMDKGREAGKQKHIKLFNPRPEVQSVFDMVGFSLMFDIFNDRNEAVQSFS